MVKQRVCLMINIEQYRMVTFDQEQFLLFKQIFYDYSHEYFDEVMTYLSDVDTSLYSDQSNLTSGKVHMIEDKTKKLLLLTELQVRVTSIKISNGQVTFMVSFDESKLVSEMLGLYSTELDTYIDDETPDEVLTRYILVCTMLNTLRQINI
jgi:hypothetical protein